MKERQIIGEAKCRNCDSESINLFPPGVDEPFECAHCNQFQAYRTPGMWFEVWVEEITEWTIITAEGSPYSIQGTGETALQAFRDLTNNIRAYANQRDRNLE